MKRILAILLPMLSSLLSPGQDSLQSRIILIGDAGELTNGHHPVVAAVRKNIVLDKKTTIVFLGDNLYKTGLPDASVPNYDKIKAPLDSQIAIGNGTPAKVYFIPGNHDWNNGNKGGWEAIQREEYYINSLGDSNLHFYPEDGCPGPVVVDLTPDVILLIIDSQWWVHPYDKPGIESDCDFKTKEEVLAQIDNILSKNSKKLTIFAFHHTLRSYGIHGGYFTLKQYLFPLTDISPKLWIPLPVIGIAYPITRSIFGTSEDMAHPAYANMIVDLNKVIKGHQNVIFASGHDHTLQLIKDTGAYYITSGTGSKSNRVSRGKKTMYESDSHGFAELDISKNKNVNVSFYTIDSSSLKKVYTKDIFNFSAPLEPMDSLQKNPVVTFKDSVFQPASTTYGNPTAIKRFFIGSNYRKEWSTPIGLKIFKLKNTEGGFTIESLGGGKQTRSLKLKDSHGVSWALRTVDKDPEKEIPEALRGTLAQRIVKDLISASHPYAALVVPTLARAIGVIQADPKYYYVPDDPAFGIYRKLFSNSVCLLERREPTLDESDTKGTGKIINKLIDDQDKHVNQQAYLRARLLDMIIGDWDRHFGQWKWGTSDTGKGKLYYPVPRDRDQAFFYSNGALVKKVSKTMLPYLEGFKERINNVNRFNYEARDIDRTFMTTLDRNDWEKAIDSFTTRLSDKVIYNAIKNLPPEIYAFDSAILTRILTTRRDNLRSEGIKYYNFISKRVKITGSNNDEYFHIRNYKDLLQVTVYKKNENGDSAVLYNRFFDKKVTKEIYLYGLNGADKFDIDQGTTSSIKIRMIGGKGNDTFNIKGKVRNYIYDQSTEKNYILNSSRSKINLTSDPQVNEYKISDFIYNQYRFPQLNLGYNAEDKLLAGIGFSAKTYGFRKEPSTEQRLTTLVAFASGSYQARYLGIFNQVFLKKDVIINAEFVNPTLNNFFGYGNESLLDQNKPIEYYRVRYKYVQTDLLLRKRIGDIIQVSIGPSYFHYWNDYNNNKLRILGDPRFIGTDSLSLFAKKDYVGGKMKLDVNFVNSEFFPSRGVTWYTELSSLYGANKFSKSLTKVTSDFTVYGSLSYERKLVGILRLGGGHIFDKSFDFFQALTLGANNFVRGYRKNRFSGSSVAYGSLEFRAKLFKSQSYIFPGDVGVITFYDIGKVWMPNATSKRWHSSYGGGLYYAPFNLVLVSATLGISNEDQLINFSIGSKFNLTF